MTGEAFYVPSKISASWNKETPATRLLVRSDFFEQAWAPLPFFSAIIPHTLTW